MSKRKQVKWADQCDYTIRPFDCWWCTHIVEGWQYVSGDQARSDMVKSILLRRAPKYRKAFKRFARMYQGHIQDVLTLFRFLEAAHFHTDIASELIDAFLDHIQDMPYKDLSCASMPSIWNSNFFMPAGNAIDECPVYIVTPANLMVHHHLAPLDEIVAYCQFVCRINEEYQYGGAAQRMYLIVDMAGFDIREFNVACFEAICRIFEVMHPHRLAQCFIVNNPKVFSRMWDDMKKAFSKDTRNRIHVLNTKFSLIRSYVAACDIDARYGGQASYVEPPMWWKKAMVPEGTRPPLPMRPKEEVQERMGSIDVPPGQNYSVNMEVSEGSILEHKFMVKKGEGVGFNAFYTSVDGSLESLLFSCKGDQTEGRFQAPRSGTIKYVFDNSSSYNSSKLNLGFRQRDVPSSASSSGDSHSVRSRSSNGSSGSHVSHSSKGSSHDGSTRRGGATPVTVHT